MGDSYFGAVPRTSPVQVQGVGGVGYLSGVVQVTAGYGDACALTSQQNVYCWGYGNAGAIGNSAAVIDQTTPLVVNAVGGSGQLSGITQITSGNGTNDHAVASTA
jgi:alpha-tubulin suppressor-like RCC1 family protein